MSTRPVGMVIASPGVQVDLEVNLKPSHDTEQGLSPIVAQEVDLEVPHLLIGKQYFLSLFFSPKEGLLFILLLRTSESGMRLLLPSIV
jgi:hypothetical protein